MSMSKPGCLCFSSAFLISSRTSLPPAPPPPAAAPG
eukprot:CAMPEP_0204075648 /NCGR_PEP_ID=MMETSP0360-20130528/166634_1 /ASSEMBLY_ACC=CAM_ASM_000342 /TAXON_ID=268821 /ORGANISM="Scrippsiella Hangoei, Strain SHTV-5" /LENGTH=35 /DNA_ID= /DNA_START= /DNA_END= /DNA_ORIENTATION=